VVSGEGEQLGIMPIAQALETARGQELDLVEVAPDAQPPKRGLERGFIKPAAA